MRGFMVILRPDGTEEVKQYTGPLPYEDLSGAVGGYIESVPHFKHYEHEGTLQFPVVAFCNEEGKIHGLPINPKATLAWEKSVGQRITRDYLVGPIAIVWGDAPFMREL